MPKKDDHDAQLQKDLRILKFNHENLRDEHDKHFRDLNASNKRARDEKLSSLPSDSSWRRGEAELKHDKVHRRLWLEEGRGVDSSVQGI